MAFEKYLLLDNNDGPKLIVHLFRAIVQEFIEGKLNAVEARFYIEEQLGITLSQPEVNDLLILLNLINDESTKPEKMAVLDVWYRVFIIAESNCSLYDTREELKTRLILNDD